MNVNDLYNSIRTFWNGIAPLIYAHVLFLLGMKYIAGISLSPRALLTQWTASERYSQGKGLLQEFELWKKLPLLLIAVVLIYLTLLQDGIQLIGRLPIPLLHMSYSEEQFWLEAKPFDLLSTLTRYTSAPEVHLWDIQRLKGQALELYSTRSPEQYKSLVAWSRESFASHQHRLEIAVVFLIAACGLGLPALRRRGRLVVSQLARLGALLILVAGYAVYQRYEAERAIEQQLFSGLLFVSDQLELDEGRSKSRRTDADLAPIRRELFDYLLNVDEEKRLDIPWLSRMLESLDGSKLRSRMHRSFSRLSKQEFRLRYEGSVIPRRETGPG